MNKNIKKLVVAAMFAAITCVATMVVRIPSPTQGYVNLGDCFVMLSGWFLGPVYGALAAGIGSMFADMFSGYPLYMPGTFVIKALMAVVAFYIAQLLKKAKLKDSFAHMLSSVCGGVIMILGYFAYSSLILGKGLAAAASIPGNVFQSAVGIIAAMVLYEVTVKNKFLKANLIFTKEAEKNGEEHSRV